MGPSRCPSYPRREDVVAWLAQRMDKTTITRLLRVSWEAVAAHRHRRRRRPARHSRLDGLFRIGVDEISYRKGHRYLTVVADHDRDGAVVWAGEGKTAATLEAFYDQLGDERCAAAGGGRLDMGGAYKKATDARPPKPASASTRSTWCSWPTRPSTRPAAGPGTRTAPADAAPRRLPRRSATRPGPLGQAHPLGAAQRPRPADRLPARRAPRAAPQPIGALPLLATQRRPARPLSAGPTPPTPPSISTGGWPGPAAAASPPSSPSPRPSAPTATASSPPSSSACRTRSSKASTARSASSTTAATATTPPPPSSP